MKLSMAIKQDIAKKAIIAIIAKRRDSAYDTLRRELTDIAERQYSNVPLQTLRQYAEYIEYDNYLHEGKEYPKDLTDIDRSNFKHFGFIFPGDIPLLREFPCKKTEYIIRVNSKYTEEYISVVRKYISIYFEAKNIYNLILDCLKTINTDKQLEDEFPELLIFYTLPEDDEEKTEPDEKIKMCKSLLKRNRELFIENL